MHHFLLFFFSFLGAALCYKMAKDYAQKITRGCGLRNSMEHGFLLKTYKPLFLICRFHLMSCLEFQSMRKLHQHRNARFPQWVRLVQGWISQLSISCWLWHTIEMMKELMRLLACKTGPCIFLFLNRLLISFFEFRLIQLSFQEWTQQMREMLDSRKRGDLAFRDKDFKAAIECYSQV